MICKTLAFIALATLSTASCSKDKSKQTKGTTDKSQTDKNEPPATDPAPVKKKTPAPQPQTQLTAVLAPYEACRSLLANDKTDGIKDCAEQIATGVGVAKKALPQKAHAHLTAAADAAAKLVATTDIAATRLAFGEVSKSLVALLGAAPKDAEAYHVFECPMAKGYKRWIQPVPEIGNPYMGQKMLTCGSKVPTHGSVDHGHAHGDSDHNHSRKGKHSGHNH